MCSMIRIMANVDLGHNPDASADEIRRFREGFNLKSHLSQNAKLNDGAGAPRVDPSEVPQPKASDTGAQNFGPNESAKPNRGRAEEASDKPQRVIDLLKSFSQPEELAVLQVKLKDDLGIQMAPFQEPVPDAEPQAGA